MESYLVPAAYGEAEFTEKRSRFIGRVWRTDDETEALERIRETREAHRDASHNVYAYIIRENNLTRYSDDGEPGGSSGMPTLNVFASKSIQNVCCVVTRYFGGTLLGTGGLARAYSKAAKLALEAAGIALIEHWSVYRIICGYSFYDSLLHIVKECGAEIKSSDFLTDIELLVYVREDIADSFEERVLNSSSGKASCVYLTDESK